MAASIAAALRGLDFVMADFSENGCRKKQPGAGHRMFRPGLHHVARTLL
jgi:hypothetical protein